MKAVKVRAHETMVGLWVLTIISEGWGGLGSPTHLQIQTPDDQGQGSIESSQSSGSVGLRWLNGESVGLISLLRTLWLPLPTRLAPNHHLHHEVLGGILQCYTASEVDSRPWNHGCLFGLRCDRFCRRNGFPVQDSLQFMPEVE